MSTKVTVDLVCDLGPDDYGEHPARWTVRLGVDGQEYEADLCDGHAAGVEHAFAPFIRAARPAHGSERAPRTAARKHRSVAARRRTAAIRAWAKREGLAVSDRGRIPAPVTAQYEAGHGGRAS